MCLILVTSAESMVPETYLSHLRLSLPLSLSFFFLRNQKSKIVQKSKLKVESTLLFEMQRTIKEYDKHTRANTKKAFAMLRRKKRDRSQIYKSFEILYYRKDTSDNIDKNLNAAET